MLKEPIEKPVFTIIVPVYNDADKLPRCLDSILSQQFANFECLIINDGSMDSTPEICDSYADKDKRIRVFHKENEGTGKTRQFGIDQATGNYICFIDSDDFVDSAFLDNIQRRIIKSNKDIFFMDFFEENTKGKFVFVDQNPVSIDTETVLCLVLEGKLYSCLWNVVIKHDFYVKLNTQFTHEINYGEDSLFLIELLLNNAKIDYISGANYYHSINLSSYTRTNKKQKFIDRLKFLEYLDIFLEKYQKVNLAIHNFFPFNDKYEILCSGLFKKDEYLNLLPIKPGTFYFKRAGFKKFIRLKLAEGWMYTLIKYSIIFPRSIKNKLKGRV